MRRMRRIVQDFLLKYPKTLLIVSHAREFLNAVCTDVIHLHRCLLLIGARIFFLFCSLFLDSVKKPVHSRHCV